MNGSCGPWLRWEWANSLRTNTVVFLPCTSILRCPSAWVFFQFLCMKKAFFDAEEEQFVLYQIFLAIGQPGFSVIAQPFFADQDLGSARVHQNVTSLFFSEKTSDAIKWYLSLWDSYLVIRKVLPATRLSHSRFSMPLNICLLKPYLWSVASLGQSLPATPFLQHLVKLCTCYMSLLGEHHPSDHPHCSKCFGVSELTIFSCRSWHLCLDCNLYRELHFVYLFLWLTSTGLGSPPTLI